MRQLRPYLNKRIFVIQLDHFSLRRKLNLIHTGEEVSRRPLELLEIDFDVVYIAVVIYEATGALSRLSTEETGNKPSGVYFPVMFTDAIEKIKQYYPTYMLDDTTGTSMHAKSETTSCKTPTLALFIGA